jgi:amino acid adenylation domain-containing protein
MKITHTKNDLEKRIDALSPAKRAIFEMRLREELPEEAINRRMSRRPDVAPPPMSFAQQRMWFLDQLEPGSPFYNVPIAISLKGPLHADALKRSINEIVGRHEALRTTFPNREGNPVQVIAPHLTLELPVKDLRGIPEGEREGVARRLAGEESLAPFDLSSGPLVRVHLLRLGNEEHAFLLTMHHIISDGWSMGVFFRELVVLYEAFSRSKPSPLPDLPLQYADFAHWQRQWFQGEVLERQLSYWKRGLGGELPVLDLPADRPRPPIQTYHGATQSIFLSLELAESLKALGRQEGVTLFMTLLAAFQTLLYRYVGQDDIIVGSPIANRNRVEIEGLIGLFVNTLVLRTDLSGDPGFRELLGRVRKVAMGAYAHQDLPFEKLVEEIRPKRDTSRTPLFQVMIQLTNVPRDRLDLPGIHMEDFKFDNKVAKFDLSVDVTEEAGGLSCLFEYNTDLFDPGTITRFMGHFQTLLEGIVAVPDQKISKFELLTEKEHHRILLEWNDTRVNSAGEACLHNLFEAQVNRTPEATAVSFEDRDLTYRELNRRANQLANYLGKKGVRPEVLVGICMERSLEMVVGILGVLKAGGAYVPLDPADPEARLTFMLQDTNAPVVLTQSRFRERLPARGIETFFFDAGWERVAQESAETPACSVTLENLAYVIYTSGSTGKPKGVMVPHRAVCNNLHWVRKRYRLTESDVVLQISSFVFDASISEIFAPLLSGARLVLARSSEQYEPGYLVKVIGKQGVTIIQLVPSLLRVLLDEEGFPHCRSLRCVIGGGETMPVELEERFYKTLNAELYNTYGPTETAIDATCWPCNGKIGGRSVPIGRPIDNFQLYILDRNLQPVPIGVPGELHIGGAGLARGYLNNNELTAEKFIVHPFGHKAGERLYKTGDLVRYLPDGNIEFIGRIDHQVKVRGFRIEPGEIEAVLRQHPGVRDAVVLAREDPFSGRRLVAYIIPSGKNPAPMAGELRDFLKRKLPEYMVPAFHVTLEAFPLTTTGKVDRRALPDPGQERSEPEGTYVAPRDELETQLKVIWEKVLGIKPVGVRDNFFELGGHSLLAVQLFAQIVKTYGKSLPLTTLFQAPTVEDLAKIIRKEGWETKWSFLVPIQPGGSKPPFFCVHPHDGNAIRFRDLAARLGPDQPFYGLRALLSSDGEPVHTRIEDMAADYIEEMLQIQPKGPYFLGGHCFGGTVAFEMAQQLLARGEKVALLALIFASAPGEPRLRPNVGGFRFRLYTYFTKIDQILTNFSILHADEVLPYILQVIGWAGFYAKKNMKKIAGHLFGVAMKDLTQEQEMDLTNILDDYIPKVYPGKLLLFRSEKIHWAYSIAPTWGWGELAAGGLDIYEIPGHNHAFAPRFRILGELLQVSLAQTREAGDGGEPVAGRTR